MPGFSTKKSMRQRRDRRTKGRPAMTWVKICGITNVDDAMAAVSAGVDALGFVFGDSPRRIEPEKAVEIATAIRRVGGVELVGVFLDETAEKMEAIAGQVGLDLIQLHGSEPPEVALQLGQAGRRVIKAVRMRDRHSLDGLERFLVHGYLLDAWSSVAAGGTGQPFDWNLAAHAQQFRPLILAGGLHPGNVRQALEVVRPDGVDVSSGVESVPGRKNRESVAQFIREVRTYDARVKTT